MMDTTSQEMFVGQQNQNKTPIVADTNTSDATHLSVREKVNIIEAEMLRQEQVEIPVRHHFSKGVYAREITIPAGVLLTGKIHRYQNLNILSAGEMSVLTENGVVRVKAPYTVVSPPGTKRIAYTHTECVWTTIHGTEETDVDKIEARFIAQDEAEYQAFIEQEKLKEIDIWPGY